MQRRKIRLRIILAIKKNANFSASNLIAAARTRGFMLIAMAPRMKDAAQNAANRSNSKSAKVEPIVDFLKRNRFRAMKLTRQICNYFLPCYRVNRVTEISVELLREWQIDSLLLDVDGTLKEYRATSPPPDIFDWICTMRGAGIKLALISNGRASRVTQFADPLNLPFFALAKKPLPFSCHAAMKKFGFKPTRTTLVGDQLFTDILAARWAGVKSILVTSIAPEQEPWFARIKRPLERFVFANAKQVGD